MSNSCPYQENTWSSLLPLADSLNANASFVNHVCVGMWPWLYIHFKNKKEMIVDYRKRRAEHTPILIDGAVVEQVETFKFIGVHINNKLECSKYTKTVVKRARQSLFPLRKLKRFGMGPEILKRFYICNIESILTGCITAWYGNCSASDRKAPQRVMPSTSQGLSCLPSRTSTEEGPKNRQRSQSPQS